MRGGEEMSMPAGLAKATNYYNRQEAWKDWLQAAKIAHYFGLSKFVKELQPDAAAGWKKIDGQTHKLRVLIEPHWKAATEKPLPWAKDYEPVSSGHTAAEPGTGPCEEEKR
jgi:hypothetical protein